MLFPTFLYLVFGFFFIRWLGKKGALTVVNNSLWGLAWLLWPLILILILYLILNALVVYSMLDK